MPLMKSWVTSANSATHPFPLNNLPYGVFSVDGDEPRCGVAIGDMILDMQAAEEAGLVQLTDMPLFDVPYWNDLMEQGPAVWTALRERLTSLLAEGAAEQDKVEPLLVPASTAELHMPFAVSEYTDFYAGKNHAFNVGTMFRGPENALPPNWLHIPIGYNGRASSVVVSGTDVRRPWGQLKGPNDDAPRWAPCARFDIELELGAIVGTSSEGPITVQQADDHIFGYVLLNDWSARDIQACEYVPLGPFLGKSFATSIGAWVTPMAALSEAKVPLPGQDPAPLRYLAGEAAYGLDIHYEVDWNGTIVSRPEYREMYWSPAQMVAHMTVNGATLRSGDIFGSGTISGPAKETRGCFLELTWSGQEPVTLADASTRTFLEDGDTITLRASAPGPNGTVIGLAECVGTIAPAP